MSRARRADRSEAGDTLIEVLIAIVILSIATLSLLTAFATAISGSATHRSLATFDTVIRSASEQAVSEIQQSPNPLYESCATASYYAGAMTWSLPSGYTATVSSVLYWNGTGFTSSCTVPNSPQWITITVKNTQTGQSYTNNFIVDNPYAPPIPQNNNAYQLVFVQEPAGADAGADFSSQPVVAIEDAEGHVVTTDLSPVTLSITPNTGTSGANLSSYCSGVETAGVVTFSNCAIDTAGLDYQLTATDPGLVSAISTAFNVYNQLTAPVITAAIPSPTQAGAINVTYTGASNAPVGETYTATACANSGLGFGCVTQANFTSGSDITGLTPGTNYYVTVTANAPTPLYLSQVSATAGPIQATEQLNAPSGLTVAFGSVAGSIQVTFTAPTPTAAGQVYTATACTNLAMTSGCVSGSVTSGGNLTGLAYVGGSPGTSYYVDVVAAASSGFLASQPSAIAGPQADESAVNAPGGFSTASSLTTAGAISVTFSASTGATSPSSYTATICTNALMTAGCSSQAISPGTTSITGLTQGTGYYVQITANSPSGAFASASTSVSGRTLATTQLTAPTGISLAYGTAAGSIAISFTAPSNAAPSQTYTVVACTNSTMSTGCVTNNNYSSGANLTGLGYAQGSAGTNYWVTVTSNASTGYFASSASAVNGPQAATSQVDPPGTPTASTSTTTGGAITVVFTASAGTPPASYTATACTNTGMSSGCVTGAITSGGTLSGLVGKSSYYVEITAVPPAGYVSATSPHSVSPTTASVQLATPTITSAAPSTTTAGAIKISYSGSSNAPGGQTYTAEACTDLAMTIGCVTQAGFSSGSSMTGLVSGTQYYVTITANASAGYIAATTAADGPILATVQLATPGTPTLAYGTVAGSIAVTVTDSNAPAGQLYTIVACTNLAMSTLCVTTTNVASGGNAVGLTYTQGSPGTPYYVTATAQASSGYLGSGTSGVAGPQAATSQLFPPGKPSVASSTTTAGAITATFTASAGPTLSSYSATVCTNAAMTANCVTVNNYTSGSQLTGLNQGSGYYAVITAQSSSAAYAPSPSPTSSSSAMATVQLTPPTITSVSPSTTTPGQLSVTFAAPLNAGFGQTYTAEACTNVAMTTGCVGPESVNVGTSTFTGLAAGSSYYVTITAPASNGYLSSISNPPFGPTLATVQLATPGTPTLAYGTVAGSIAVTVTDSNAPAGQLYTVKACTNSSMTTGCVTDTNVLSGGNATGLAYTAGSAGGNYWIQVTAQASSGYLASGPSATAGPQADTSSLRTPTNLVTASSITTGGAVTATFTASTGTPPASYTATACTDAAMTQNCVTVTNYTSGAQLTGLTAGTEYYVTITAVSGSAAYASATTTTSGPTLATTQLTTPTGVSLAYGTVAGSIAVSYTGSSNAAAGQSYTVEACTNLAMSTGCVTNANLASGSNLTGLAYTQGSPGTSYYVTVTANASAGYLASAATAPAGPQADTSSLGAPGTPVPSSSTILAGAITATFTASAGAAPSSYTVEACTNAGMTTGCLTQAFYASGAQIQPLTEGTSYYVQVTAVSVSGAYASTASAVSATSAMATIQLVAPTITAVAASTTTPGALTVTFTAPPNAAAGQTYTAEACTDAAMTQNCVTQGSYTSGAQFTGLTQGTAYYVTITANASSGYLAMTSSAFGPTGSTIQLATPTGVSLAYGTVAGSIAVSYTGSSNAAAGQTYTAKACTNLAMTTGCVTNANLASGSNLTGLAYSQGSAGTSYYVTVTANASAGYLASAATAPAGPQAATSQVNAPGTPTVATSVTTAGAITATFSASTGTAPSSYTATACTNAGMTIGCVTQASYTSGAQLTGLTQGSSYFVTITAVGPAGYAPATSAVSASSAKATTQLATPTGVSLAYGTVAGSIAVSYTGSSNAAGGQTYTVEACTNFAMSTGCVTNANLASGSNLTGLAYTQGSPGTSYYVTVTANASAGYLASAATAAAGPQAATSQVNAPGTPTVATSANTAGAITATFSASTGTAPASYTAKACTNAGMTIGCVTQANYTSGAQLTGLTQGSSYFVTITAIGPAGYASATSAVSASSATATTQLATPTGVSLAYGTVAGSIAVSFTGSSNAPGGQTYTVEGCTNFAMTTGCVTNASFASGSNLTGLAYTAGSAGTSYYVTVTANGSSGYLVSLPTAAAGPQAATSQMNPPGTPTVATSSTTAGAITATFTAPAGTAPTSYTATACTNSIMTIGCVTQGNYTSGAQLTGLTQGTSYYVYITTVGPAGYISATSLVSVSAAVAATQLSAPVITSVSPSSTTAGQLTIAFTGSGNAPGGQSYTAVVCTNAGMTIGCVTQANYTSGSQVTSLTAGTNYWARITAVASSGYLATNSTVVGPTMSTQQLAAASISSAAPSSTTAGAITVTFTAPGNAPGGQSYTAVACTNLGMTIGCVTQASYTSGAQLTGLAQGSSYYVEITSNASSGYLASTTAAFGPTMATVQLATAGTPTLAYGTAAGSLAVTFSGSGNAPGGQTYTATACTNVGMTIGCVSGAVTSGGNLTGLTFTQGSAGTAYFVTVTANASSGYLASAASSVSASHADTSQVNPPTGFSASSSTTTAGAITATFTNSTGTAPSSYSAQICTNPGMTTGCTTVGGYTSGTQITGLTAGTTYYVQVTAVAPAGYVSAATAVSSGTPATIQLNATGTPTLAYGTVAGSLAVTFTGSSNAAGGQTYTAKACTNLGMTIGCVTGAVTSGGNLTGLAYTQGSVGTAYYVTVTANASSGYLASAASSVSASHVDTSQVNPPTGLSTNPSITTAGAVTATFTSSTGTAPSSYSAQACTNSGMTIGCVTQAGYTSGAQLTGLTQGTNYYVQITAVAPVGYVSAATAVSSATLATTQLNAPGTPTLAYGTVAGSLAVTFTGSSNAAGGQTYTATACTNSGMTIGCVSGTVTSGGNLTGLAYTQGSAGTAYFVEVIANASAGYLVSSASPVSASHADTSQVNAPTGVTVATGNSHGRIVISFTASAGVAPASYSDEACTNAAMTTGCQTFAPETSGAQVSGLTSSITYYVEVTAVGATGYLSTTSTPPSTGTSS